MIAEESRTDVDVQTTFRVFWQRKEPLKYVCEKWAMTI